MNRWRPSPQRHRGLSLTGIATFVTIFLAFISWVLLELGVLGPDEAVRALGIGIVFAFPALSLAGALLAGFGTATGFGSAVLAVGLLGVLSLALRQKISIHRNIIFGLAPLAWILLRIDYTIVSENTFASLVVATVAYLVGFIWGQSDRIGSALKVAGWLALAYLTYVYLIMPKDVVEGERFNGLSANPNGLGVSVLLIVPLLVNLLRPLKLPIQLLGLAGVLYLSLGTISLSGSLQSLLGFAVVFPVSVLLILRWRISFAIVGLLAFATLGTAFVGVAISEKFATELQGGEISGRRSIWTEMWENVSSNVLLLLFGSGRRRMEIETDFVARGAHNIFLALLILGGLVALALWLLAWWKALSNSWGKSPVVSVMVLSLIPAGIASATDLSTYTWATIGIGLGLVSHSNTRRGGDLVRLAPKESTPEMSRNN